MRKKILVIDSMAKIKVKSKRSKPLVSNSKDYPREQYELGTPYLSSPGSGRNPMMNNAAALIEAQIAGQNAAEPWQMAGMISNQVSNALMSMAGSMGGNSAKAQAILGGASKLNNFGQGLSQVGNAFANGGIVPVEVEGDEIGQLPNGMMLNFQGPSHEQGGIDADLPQGTKIYSDRVQIDGKTMADRKKKREKTIANLEKKSKEGDRIAKDTLDRYMLTAGQEEQLDMSIQELLNNPQQYAGGGVVRKKYALGDNGLEWEDEPETVLEKQERLTNLENKENKRDQIWSAVSSMLPTIGDTLGMIGNYKQTADNRKFLQQSRADDLRNPNPNYFKDFGKNALKTLENSKQFAAQQKGLKDRRLQSERTAAVGNNRISARSINTQRALNQATQSLYQKGVLDIEDQYINQILEIMGQQANQQNAIDQAVMSGEREADISNRQDLASYRSLVRESNRDTGQMIANQGKNLNAINTRTSNVNMLNALGKYFGIDAMGNLTGKGNVPVADIETALAEFLKNTFGWNDKQVKEFFEKNNKLETKPE